MRRLLLISVLLLVTMAAPAQAGSYFVDGAPWSAEADIAYRVGLAYWNVSDTPPLCGSVEKASVQGGAETAYHYPAERGISSEPKAAVPVCYLGLNASLPFRTQCSTAVFLVGHLAGQTNSTDPGSVMYVGWPGPAIGLCEDEALRLEGYGDVARGLIAKARARCDQLHREKAERSRQVGCRKQQARVTRANAKYLRDPYVY